MPFSNIPKNPGDLIKSADWNSTLKGIADLFVKFDKAAGHAHTGAVEDGPPIPEAGIANNAISTLKIKDGSITAAKVVAGTFSRDIGIAFVFTLSNGQTIPPPSGFAVNECIFFVAATSASVNNAAAWSYTVKVDPSSGKVTISTSANMGITVSGLAMAKRGGW